MTDLIARLIRFGIVGVTAACVHYMIVVSLVQHWQYQPLSANIIGFLFAFQLSYFGHRFWTFQDTQVLHRSAYPKLFLLQSFNLAANESLFYILLAMHLPYKLALILVLAILPIFTYLANRFWVFV